MSQSNTSFPRLTHLGDISIEIFLAEYWQKKPLLIRQAFPGFCALISAEELAGLSLEEEVESRLITQQGQDWQVQHGPIAEDTYSTLPERDWTLLVQHADSIDPGFNDLLNAFRFIPNWRLDDIMVSYATDGGGVGPHFDYYDVFLLQAEGKRRWRIGQRCDSHSPLQPDLPMKVLKNFETQEDWVLEPGDMLYIPPNVAHWGEAVGECMTYSVGFRAPSHADFLLDYAQEIASTLPEDDRFGDPLLTQQENPGEITTAAIQQFREILQSITSDDKALASWIGQYSTQLKQPVEGMSSELSSEELLSNALFRLSPYNRVSFHLDDASALCFINGEQWVCSALLAEKLSNYSFIRASEFSEADQDVLNELADSGLLTHDDRQTDQP